MINITIGGGPHVPQLQFGGLGKVSLIYTKATFRTTHKYQNTMSKKRLPVILLCWHTDNVSISTAVLELGDSVGLSITSVLVT